MSDLPTTTILVGLAVALARAIEWLAKALLSKNGKHTNGLQAGQLTPLEWEARMRALHEESEERTMRDMRALMEARTLTLVEKVTQPIVSELQALRREVASRRPL